MGKLRNQDGFTAVEGILIAVIVCLVGFVGWYVWHNHKTAPISLTSQSRSATTNTSSSTQDTSLDITEWGVSMTIPQALGKVTYSIASNGTDLNFSSDLQKTMPASCNLSQASGPWGIASYTDATVDPSQKAALTHIGNSYYQFVYPQEGCNEANALNSDYLTMFSSVKAN